MNIETSYTHGHDLQGGSAGGNRALQPTASSCSSTAAAMAAPAEVALPLVKLNIFEALLARVPHALQPTAFSCCSTAAAMAAL